MSDYRDDVNVTAVISDTLLSTIRDVGEATAFISSVLLFTIGVTVTDAVTAGEEIVDRIIPAPSLEVITISDHVDHKLIGTTAVDDVAVARDMFLLAKIRSVLEASTVTSDEVVERLFAGVSETATVSSATLHTIRHQVSDAVNVADRVFTPTVTEDVVDEVAASDITFDKLRTYDTLVTQAVAIDALFDGFTSCDLVVEVADTDAITADALLAAQLFVDSANVWDDLLGVPTYSAWTANPETWAMSRYTSFDMNSVIMIDEVMYFAGDDGVYALDGDTEMIAASLVSGKMKLGDELCLADAAYIDYSMDGDALLTVTTHLTTEESFEYALDSGASETLTSGRFKLGRGIKDKHLSFKLNIDATKALITRFYVSTQKFTRRIK